MSGRNAQLNIKLTEERKQRWKEAAEATERSLSNFIRHAVEQEISDDTRRGSSQHDETVTNRLDTIIEEVQSLDATLDGGPGSISHRLRAIEGQLADDPEARDFATTVYGLLPDEEQVTTLPGMDDPSARVGENGRVVTGDPEHIAEYMAYAPDIETEPDSTQVRQALDDLQSEMHNVQRLGDGRYYRT